KQASHPNMASIEMRKVPSPAPTYRSTFNSQEFASRPKGSSSNNPYFQYANDPTPAKGYPARDATHRNDDDDSPVRADYHDPNHPHFAKPAVPNCSSTLPQSHRFPHKRVLIPWILAIIFFLTTAWYTSILAGARFLSIIYPLPAAPAVQEINIIVSDETFHGIVTAVPPIQIGSTSTATQTSISTATPTTDTELALPTTTGRLHLAPKPGTPPEDNTGANQGTTLSVRERNIQTIPTGFVTITTRP
ncbi:hypothetical protein BKA66DRAFT_418414, partial [Pyrenochaeta sp. MPI-SDFR-AT-0127]